MAIYKIKFDIYMPRSYFIIQLFLLIALTCISRFGYRVFRAILIRLENTKKTTNTMLIGAGDAGRIIIDEVRMNKNSQDVPISCVIDDNKSNIAGADAYGIHTYLFDGDSKKLKAYLDKLLSK
jgi:FlaA1/EpsC-like NDP-sugar epimerase